MMPLSMPRMSVTTKVVSMTLNSTLDIRHALTYGLKSSTLQIATCASSHGHVSHRASRFIYGLFMRLHGKGRLPIRRRRLWIRGE